jgi:polyphenol oxidase
LPPYDSLNLGDHVGDRGTDVAANRKILRQAIPAKPVFLTQVHGAQVVCLTDQTTDGTVADACITDQRGVACTIMVADCLPILLTNEQGSRVAAVHAGWRGLAGCDGDGVLESAVRCFGTQVMAWLGPCIGPQAFEVGADVRDAFVANDPAAKAFFIPHASGKWMADLQGLARQRLAGLGVKEIFGNDGSQDWCTFSQLSRFFSHRRDGVSGRMAACIWLE